MLNILYHDENGAKGCKQSAISNEVHSRGCVQRLGGAKFGIERKGSLQG